MVGATVLRRSFLGGGLAAACVGSNPSFAAEPLDLQSSQGKAYAYVKLHVDVAGEAEGVNSVSGMIYAVVGDTGAVTPMVGCEGFSVARVEPQADGSFRYRLQSVMVYVDPATRLPLDRWTNPLSGETVTVHHGNTPSVCRIVGGPLSRERPAVWTLSGDEASYSSHGSRIWDNPLDPAVWPRESAGKRIRTAEFAKVFASRKELEDRRLIRAGYTGVWNSMTPWEPWMLMGQAPGHLYQTSTTRRLASVDALNPAVRAYALAKWPGCLSAPKVWDTTNLQGLALYARTHRPAPVKTAG